MSCLTTFGKNKVASTKNLHLCSRQVFGRDFGYFEANEIRVLNTIFRLVYEPCFGMSFVLLMATLISLVLVKISSDVSFSSEITFQIQP